MWRMASLFGEAVGTIHFSIEDGFLYMFDSEQLSLSKQLQAGCHGRHDMESIRTLLELSRSNIEELL